MFPAAGSRVGVDILSVDPTDHGSNLGVVAALAVGILALIGVIVFVITRDRRGPRSGPGPGPDSGSRRGPGPGPGSDSG